MDTMLESEEAGNRAAVTFNIHDTSGGIVNNTNGDITITMGDYHVHFHINPAPGFQLQAVIQMLDQVRAAFSTPLARFDQPHNPRPSEPVKDMIAFNHVVRAMVELVHQMMENQTLYSSEDLLKTLASLQQNFRLTDLAPRVSSENFEEERERESTEMQDVHGDDEDKAAERPYSVQQLTYDIDSLDITGYVRRDPEHPQLIGSGPAGMIHRGLYEWTDPHTMEIIRMKVAVKQILTSSGTPQQIEQRIRREVAVWRDLKHPNVTEFLGVAQMEPKRPPGLVSRFLYRNQFLDYIGRHPELKRQMALDIARGVQYLHTRDPPVIHGDIKPVNILISDNDAAQLNDFGASRILEVQGFDEKATRNMRYTAPELLPMELPVVEPRPTMQSDVFSLGMLLLVLFNHRPNIELQMSIPYNHIRLVDDNGTSEVKFLKRIHAGERPMRDRYPAIESDGIWHIITSCWQGHPMQRPTGTQLVASLDVINNAEDMPASGVPTPAATTDGPSVGLSSGPLSWAVKPSPLSPSACNLCRSLRKKCLREPGERCGRCNAQDLVCVTSVVQAGLGLEA